MDSKKLVVVVGAGLAGLAAARELQANGIEALVLEAADDLGGRIKQLRGFMPWPVEIGPEFLHGKQNSSIVQIAAEIGCKTRELRYPDFYYIGREDRLITPEEAEDHPDIQMVHRIFAALAGEEHPSPDICMDEFLRRLDVSDAVLELAESIYANDFGCSLHQLGVGECIDEARQWIYGDSYMILDKPLSRIVDHLSRDLNAGVVFLWTKKTDSGCEFSLQVMKNHAVEEIAYSANGVELRCRGGAAKIQADAAIVTVPVSVLTSGTIRFDPPLPEEKMEAAAAIGMSNAVKILLAFSRRFWPEEMFDVVCTDCFVPEFWSTEYPREEPGGGGDEEQPLGSVLLVGFIAGEAAAAASKLSHGEIFSRALSQLDDIFGRRKPSRNGEAIAIESFQQSGRFYTRAAAAAEDLDPELRPASFYFAGAALVDWSREEFVRGGYTHPSLNARGARRDLAGALDGRLFFAGEATHCGVNPCMQAAIDTGIRAAGQVLKF